MTCSCGGKVLTVYTRQGKPLKWVPLGKACIQCRWWEGDADIVVSVPEFDLLKIPRMSPNLPDSAKGKASSRSLNRPPVDKEQARKFRERYGK